MLDGVIVRASAWLGVVESIGLGPRGDLWKSLMIDETGAKLIIKLLCIDCVLPLWLVQRSK